MDDGTEDTAGLARLQKQRGRLADRVRAPWWYLAGVGVVMALVCAVPFWTHYLSWGNWSLLVAIAMFYLLQWGLARATGVAIGTRTLRYQAGRLAGLTVVVVVAAAVVAETLLLGRGQGGIAAAIGIVAVAAAVVCWRAHLRGIRRDLRAGTEAV